MVAIWPALSMLAAEVLLELAALEEAEEELEAELDGRALVVEGMTELAADEEVL